MINCQNDICFIDCNYDANLGSTSLFPDCDSCSVDTSTSPITTTCLTCRNGFLRTDLTPPKCDVNCPMGYYGRMLFGPRGRPTVTDCQSKSKKLKIVSNINVY